MKIMQRLYLLISAIIIGIPSLYGQDKQIKVGAPFLNITPDARSAGYGDQGAATTPDNFSQFWNPAKYIFTEKSYGAAYSYTPWLKNIANDIALHSLSGFYKFDNNQVVSASLRYFSIGEIPLRSESGQDPGGQALVAKPNEFAFDVAYSRKLGESFSTSVTFRYFRSDLTGGVSIPDIQGITDIKTASSFAADIAAYYFRQLGKGELAVGGSISNIGPKISYSKDGDKSFIPTNLRIGARYTLPVGQKSKISALLETAKLLVPTPDIDQNGKDKNADKSVVSGIFSSFADAPGGFKEEMNEFVYSAGLEYTYANTLALRSGYFNENKEKGNRKFFTFGLGVTYNIFTIDASYLVPSSSGSNSPLDNTFRFSLGIQMPTK